MTTRITVLLLLTLGAVPAFADSAESGLPLPGLRQGFHGRPRCSAAPYRQFDFWVGDFRVVGPAGVTGATNRITTDLDGCAVEEHWAPNGGPAGRSLNSYDAVTGTWHQTWVPATGRPFRMTGGLRPDGVMAMNGRRVQPGYPPEFDWVDHYTWTALDHDTVVQAFTFDYDYFNIHIQGSITYQRSADLPAMQTRPNTRCTSGDAAATRELDFTVGQWSVRTLSGLELGKSDVVIDPTLSGCLLEESLTTRIGYRSTGWAYFDPVEQRFYRMVVDSEGNRIELSGDVSTGGYVLEGANPLNPNGRVRMTWTPLSADALIQGWEVSSDSGATWKRLPSLEYQRR